MELYATAESTLLHDLPCIPLFVYVSQNLVDPRVGGFGANVLNDQSPKQWYWMDDAELAKQRESDRRRVRRVPSHGPREGLYPPARAAEGTAK
ncbi:MAG: hypothetical protein IT454_05810 [Planctomycetes bacterium]|nr:hypothetical protein [Planctomycetota bacterium]